MLAGEVHTVTGTVQVIDCGGSVSEGLVTGDLRVGLDDGVVASVGFCWTTRDSQKPHNAQSFGDNSGERAGHARVSRNISPSRARVVRAV